MEKDEVALQIRDGNEALKYSGKKRTLIIHYVFSSFFFYLVCNWGGRTCSVAKSCIDLLLYRTND